MRLRVLGSGSSGNCLAVRSAGGALLLVDLGLSCLETRKRAKACGFDAETAAGVLFTHDHSDHYSGLETFHRRCPEIPLFATGDTADAIELKTGVGDGWYPFEAATPFELADFTISPFVTSHDAADGTGYLIADAASAVFVGTDTGVVTTGMRDAFTRCDCAVLESNHDPVLLEESTRPVSLKQRIRGRTGHLSNEQAAELVRETNPARLRTLLLAHLSRECNTVSLARSLMAETLRELGRTDVTLDVLDADVPSALYVF